MAGNSKRKVGESSRTGASSREALYPMDPPSPKLEKGKPVKHKGQSSTIWNYYDGKAMMDDFKTGIAFKAGARQQKLEDAEAQLQDAAQASSDDSLAMVLAKFQLAKQSVNEVDSDKATEATAQYLEQLTDKYSELQQQDHSGMANKTRERLNAARNKVLQAVHELGERVERDQCSSLQAHNDQLKQENEYLRLQNKATHELLQNQLQLFSNNKVRASQKQDRGALVQDCIAEFQTNLKQSETRLRRYEANLSFTEFELRESKEANVKLQEQVTTLKAKVDALEDHATGLQTSASERSGDLQSQVKQLKSNLRDVRTSLDEARTDRDSAKKAHRSQLEALTKERDQIKSKLYAAEKLNNDLSQWKYQQSLKNASVKYNSALVNSVKAHAKEQIKNAVERQTRAEAREEDASTQLQEVFKVQGILNSSTSNAQEMLKRELNAHDETKAKLATALQTQDDVTAERDGIQEMLKTAQESLQESLDTQEKTLQQLGTTCSERDSAVSDLADVRLLLDNERTDHQFTKQKLAIKLLIRGRYWREREREAAFEDRIVYINMIRERDSHISRLLDVFL